MSLAAPPRVCNAPPGDPAAAIEAIDLADSVGVHLDPWQQDVIRWGSAERPDGKWSAFEVALIVGRQNGKGEVILVEELGGLFLFGDRLILHSAHEFKTATEAFRRLLAVVDGSDDLRRLVKKVQIGHGDEGIELRSGARIRFVARSTGSGRGFTADKAFLDEAYALTSAQLEALLPTMSARPNPQIWYTSSPPLDGDSGAQLMRVRKRGLAGNDTRLCYLDYGADGDLETLNAIDLDDVELWRACNPAYGIRISKEFIQAERAAMTDVGFARERLGIWPAPMLEGGAIDTAKWAKLTDPKSKRAGDIAVGIDISPLRDFAAITVYGPRADGTGHAQVVRYLPGTAWIIEACVQIRQALDPVAWGMGTGTFKSLQGQLAEITITEPKDPDRPRRGDICVVGGPDMAAACGQVLDAVTQATLRHVGDKALDQAVAGAKLRHVGDVVAWGRKISTTDISPLVALTVARFAYAARIEAARTPYVALDNIW